MMAQQQRIASIDFIKCVCIVLMVVFHLSYFTSKYPLAHKMVYVFHMPIFLVLSGYLTHIGKPIKDTLLKIMWIFLPYAVMELGYVLLASILPINEHIDNLTFGVVLNKLFLHPIGPYWYLHTLVICYSIINLVSYARKYLPDIAVFIFIAIIFYVLDAAFKIVSFTYSMYFLFGFILAQKQLNLQQVFPISWWTIVPIVLLYWAPHLDQPFAQLDCTNLRGVMIVYFMIGFLLTIYNAVGAKKGANILLFIGRNTLPILLFSPIFTFACKWLIVPLDWNETGFIYMLLSTAITIAGSLGIAAVLDQYHISRWLCGKKLLST